MKGDDTAVAQPLLISSSPTIDVTGLHAAQVERWDIEVNFREEEALQGGGEAQVRSPVPAGNVPAFFLAACAMLRLACIRERQMPAGLG